MDHKLQFLEENIDVALDELTKVTGSFGEIDLDTLDSQKTAALEKLDISKAKLQKIINQIRDYRFVSELSDLDVGRYIRWIRISPGAEKLTNGGIIIETKLQDDGLYAVCKNKRNMIFQVNLANSFVFLKMNDSELLIKYLYDYSKS